MMQKRSLYSLLLISFMVVFAASMAFANEVTFETRSLARCISTSANVTAVVTADSVSAIEIVVEISGDLTLPATGIFTWSPLFTKLTDRVVDETTNADGILPDTIRIAALLLDPSDGALAQGTYVVGQINFTTKDVCGGTGTMAGADFVYPIPATVTTQFVDAATSAVLPVLTNTGTISFDNAIPELAAYTNQTLLFGQTLNMTSSADDDDELNGCETLEFTKAAGPAGLTVNISTGAISWVTTAASIGLHSVTIRVTDQCDAFVEQSFTVCVQNRPPVFAACPPPIQVALGDVAAGDFNATDPDTPPPLPLVYTPLTFTGPGTPVVNPATGEFTWATVNDDPAYLGTFTLTVVVTDGAPLSTCSPGNADTCSVDITVSWGQVVIEKVHGQLQGQYAEVAVTLQTNYPIGGFDILISYDNSALSLFEVIKGEFLVDCGWEYFNYTFGPFGNCNGGCPSGMLRVVAIAEYNNGDNSPTCFTNYPPPPGTDSVIFKLKFLVSNDRTLECMYVPVQFFWLDCGDNALSSVEGDSLLISRHVYAYGDTYYPIDDTLDVVFPTYFGAQEECEIPETNKPGTWRIIDFYNGGVDIICAKDIDDRGDINLNGLANEIADAVMFSRYFVYGSGVFTIDPDGPSGPIPPGAGQIAATDINADGLVLTVADLVYLVRIITGQALPYSDNFAKLDAKNATYNFSNGILSVDPSIEFGAAFVVVKGNVAPNLRASGMEMEYAYDGTNTRILVFPPITEGMTDMATFTGDVLDVNGELVSLELATSEGAPIFAKLVPTEYALNQNYPNPFNPSTTISFALPQAGDYTLTIYNINGQVVTTFTGAAEAGFVDVVWNASDAGSGVYFYKLNSGNYSATKKMVLLK